MEMGCKRGTSSINQVTKLVEINDQTTDMDLFSVGKGFNDQIAIACVNGSIKLIGKSGRIDKSISDAHRGSVITLKWNHDGSSLASAGEEGALKIWSQKGELRTNLIPSSEKLIYSLCWSPDNNSVLMTQGKMICIVPTMPGSKQTQWKAHEGLVLKLDWNIMNNLIVSAGEDCKYKIWDSFGRPLFSSSLNESVITCVSWSPNGDCFAVGAFNMLRVCDKSGWAHSFSKPNAGSIFQVSWSHDGRMAGAACGNGNVLFSKVVDMKYEWGNMEATVEDECRVKVLDVQSETTEDLDFKDKVVNLSIGYGYLIVATCTTCQIFNVITWSSPISFDIKEIVVQIIQSNKNFALIDRVNGIVIYNYDGKQISTPKYTGMKPEYLNKRCVSISAELIALIDSSNPKIIRIFEIGSTKQAGAVLEHGVEITDISLNNAEGGSERKVCILDSSKDLYLSHIYKKDEIKIASMCESFAWHSKYDILSGICDGKLVTWIYPKGLYIDQEIFDQAKFVKDASYIGKYPQIQWFTSSLLSIRKFDGSVAVETLQPFIQSLYDFIDKNNCEKAIRICRFVKDKALWAALAGMSLNAREMNTAEIALASINEADKVQYVNYIKELPNEALRNAAVASYLKKFSEAEQVLLQSKNIYKAIKFNIKIYKWDRALELAVNSKSNIDTVLAYRQRYLKNCGKAEDNPKFLQYAGKIEVNWDLIKERRAKEKEMEGPKKQ